MYKDGKQAMWYDTMATAVKQTIIISEILDTRTRHLVQARPLRLPAKLAISIKHCLVSCLCQRGMLTATGSLLWMSAVGQHRKQVGHLYTQ